MSSYSWDRANRLLSIGGAAYAYDGDSRRIAQTVGGIVTQYLLDVQPGLSVVLAETVGANTKRFVHAPRGIHAQGDASGVWTWAVQDALGNVRLEASNALAVNGMRNFAPYLPQFGTQGAFTMPFAATGEPTDGNGLVHLRARYYSPTLGQFVSQDFVEMLNRYAYVDGNPINFVDLNGLHVTFPGFCGEGGQNCAGLLPEVGRLGIRGDGAAIQVNMYANAYSRVQASLSGNIYVTPSQIGIPLALPPQVTGVDYIARMEVYSREAIYAGSGGIHYVDVAFNSQQMSLLELQGLVQGQPIALYRTDYTIARVASDLSRSSGEVALLTDPLFQLVPALNPYGYTQPAVAQATAMATACPSPTPTATGEPEEFVGFHGTVHKFVTNLTQGKLDSSLSGMNYALSSLQFGPGLYVEPAVLRREPQGRGRGAGQ